MDFMCGMRWDYERRAKRPTGSGEYVINLENTTREREKMQNVGYLSLCGMLMRD